MTNERGTLAYARLKPSFNKSQKQKKKEIPSSFTLNGNDDLLDEDVLVVEILPPWKIWMVLLIKMEPESSFLLLKEPSPCRNLVPIISQSTKPSYLT